MPARSGREHARARHRWRRRRAGAGAVTAEQQRERGEHGDLEGAPGAQVEQVGQVGGTGDHGAADQGVEGAGASCALPVGERRGDQAGGADAGDLDRPVVTRPGAAAPRWPLQPLARAVAGEVVERPEGSRAEHRDDARPARSWPRASAAPAT